jgi:hypothetical protein
LRRRWGVEKTERRRRAGVERGKGGGNLQRKALGRDEEERKVERHSALACQEEHMACLVGFSTTFI